MPATREEGIARRLLRSTSLPTGTIAIPEDSSSTPLLQGQRSAPIQEDIKPRWIAERRRRHSDWVPLPRVPSLFRALSFNPRFGGEELEPEQEHWQRIRMAAHHVHDALDGHARPLTLPGRMASLAAMIRRQFLYKAFVVAVLLCHLGLIFVEPVSSKDDRRRPDGLTATQVRAAEAGALVVYFADSALVLHALGRKGFLANRWNLLFLATTLFMTADTTIMFFALGKRWTNTISRVLRPMLFVSYLRPLRQLLTTILRTMPRVANLFFLVAVLVAVYAVLGVQIYREVYHNVPRDADDAEDTHDVFNDPYRASIALVVLLTTENFPAVFRPALHDNPYLAVAYFLSYFFIGVWMVISLLLAIIFNVYKEIHAFKTRRGILSEQTSLLTAFIILQDSGEPLQLKAWQDLMSLVKPWASKDATRVMFDYLDADRDGHITISEFFKLVEVLHYSLYCTWQPAGDLPPRTTWQFVAHRCRQLALQVRDTAGPLVSHRLFESGARLATHLNAAVIIAAGFVNESWPTTAVLRAINLGLLVVAVCELTCRGSAGQAGHGPAGAGGPGWLFVIYQSWALDACVLVVSLATWAAPAVYQYVCCLQILRLLTLSPQQRATVKTFAKCMPFVAQIALLGLMICYSYIVIGMELYSTTMTGPRPYCKSPDEPGRHLAAAEGGEAAWLAAAPAVGAPAVGADVACIDPDENFEDPWHALLALFQISTTNNWNDVMYPNIDSTSEFSAAYFVSFYLFMVWIVINIMTALILDMFELDQHRAADVVEQIRYPAPRRGRPGDQVWTVVKYEEWTRQLVGSAAQQGGQAQELETSVMQLEEQVAQMQLGQLRHLVDRIESHTESAAAAPRTDSSDGDWEAEAVGEAPVVSPLSVQEWSELAHLLTSFSSGDVDPQLLRSGSGQALEVPAAPGRRGRRSSGAAPSPPPPPSRDRTASPASSAASPPSRLSRAPSSDPEASPAAGPLAAEPHPRPPAGPAHAKPATNGYTAQVRWEDLGARESMAPAERDGSQPAVRTEDGACAVPEAEGSAAVVWRCISALQEEAAEADDQAPRSPEQLVGTPSGSSDPQLSPGSFDSPPPMVVGADGEVKPRTNSYVAEKSQVVRAIRQWNHSPAASPEKNGDSGSVGSPHRAEQGGGGGASGGAAEVAESCVVRGANGIEVHMAPRSGVEGANSRGVAADVADSVDNGVGEEEDE